MNNYAKFQTRNASSNPVRLVLVDPATGAKTEDWIDILGVDSDSFQRARLASNRRLASYQRQLKEEQTARGKDFTPDELLTKADEYNAAEKLNLVAALVVAWSSDEPCTVDRVVAFLREAPLIADYINAAATDRQLFLMPRQSS